MPCLCAYPWVVGVGSFGDGETLVVGLTESERSPRSPMAKQALAVGVEGLGFGNALACYLIIFQTEIVAQNAASREGLHTFCPHALSCGECHMAIIKLFAHGNLKPNAKGLYEVVVLVAVVGEGMHHLHLIATLVEIKSNGERQPLAFAIGVMSVDANHRANLTFLFDVSRVHLARKVRIMHALCSLLIGCVLCGAN